MYIESIVLILFFIRLIDHLDYSIYFLLYTICILFFSSLLFLFPIFLPYIQEPCICSLLICSIYTGSYTVILLVTSIYLLVCTSDPHLKSYISSFTWISMSHLYYIYSFVSIPFLIYTIQCVRVWVQTHLVKLIS